MNTMVPIGAPSILRAAAFTGMSLSAGQAGTASLVPAASGVMLFDAEGEKQPRDNRSFLGVYTDED